MKDFNWAIDRISSDLPQKYRGGLVIGESGFGEFQPVLCEAHAGALNVDVRENVYLALTQSETLRREVDLFMYWRLFQLNPTGEAGYTLEHCEAMFGVVHAGSLENGFPGDQAYRGAAMRIFEGMYSNWNNK